MTARHDRQGKSTRDRNPLIEPHDLQCDLPLIVVHRHNAVEVATKRLNKKCIRGVRSRNAICVIAFVRRSNRWCDHVDFLPTACTVLPRMRVERSNSNLRLYNPRVAQRRIHEFDRASDGGRCQMFTDILHRDVARRARRPHPAHCIDLSEGRRVSEEMRNVVVLTLIVRTVRLFHARIFLQHRLIEWAKAEARDFSRTI